MTRTISAAASVNVEKRHGSTTTTPIIIFASAPAEAVRGSYSDSLYSPPLNPLPTDPTRKRAIVGGGGGFPLCEPINEPQGPAVKFRLLQWIWAACGRGVPKSWCFPPPPPPPPPPPSPPLRVLSQIYIYIYIYR